MEFKYMYATFVSTTMFIVCWPATNKYAQMRSAGALSCLNFSNSLLNISTVK